MFSELQVEYYYPDWFYGAARHYVFLVSKGLL